MASDSFTPHSLIEILRDLLRSEATGCLVLRAEAGSSVRVEFSRGLVDLALDSGTYRSVLASLARLQAVDIPLPAEMKTRMPEAAELSALMAGRQSNPGVREILRSATRDAVRAAFALAGGAWEFCEAEGQPQFEPDIPFTLEVLIKGLEAIDRWASVRRTLTAQDRALCPTSVPLFPIELLPLQREEGYLLGLMDGKATYADIASLFPGEADQMTRFIFAALVLGFVEFEPAVVQPFQLQAYADQKLKERQREEREMERIDRFYARLREEPPLSILGLGDDASPNDIRLAYEEAKQHLDAGGFLAGVRCRRRDELQIIQSRLVEIYVGLQSRFMGRPAENVVAEPEPRLEDLAGRRLESQKTDKQAELEQGGKRAAHYLEMAEDSFRSGDYHTTVEYCSQATRLDDRLADAHSLLAEALAMNPARRWQIRAEAAFKRALTLDPWNPQLYLKFATFYRQQGLDQRAERLEEKAFTIAPALRGDASVRPQGS